MKIDRDPIRPFAFARQYAIVSLVAVLTTATAVAILYRELSIRTIVDFGQQYNIIVATTALNTVHPVLTQYLPTDSPMTAIADTDALPAGLLGLIRVSVRDTAVERIKIYNEKGIVLYSTLKREIGMDDSSNQRFQRAIHGEICSELSYRAAFNLFDHGAGDDNLIETYVPIRLPGNPDPVGVFEIYTDVYSIVRAMTRNELLIFTGIALIMIILYGFLLQVVRRAEKVITNQRDIILMRNQTLEALSARMLASEETERRRIAWELHEEIAQTLSAVKLKVEAFASSTGQSETLLRSISSKEIVPLVQEAIRDVRTLAMDLRPPALDDFGLVATTRWLCGEAEQAHGKLGIIADISLSDEDIPDPLKSIIFRILQQTLNRLVRISGINDIHVTLRRKNELQLIVDFRVGHNEAVSLHEPMPSSEQQRIANLWERAVLSGGSFSATHIVNGRFRYQASWTV